MSDGHLAAFFSPLGLLALSLLDGTPAFFAPLAVDIVIIVLAARQRDPLWLYVLLATAGSLVGSYATFWIGRRAGEKGLARFASRRHLDRLMRRVRRKGAVALAASALIPPPFPFTLLILTCGALGVSASRFFLTLAAARVLRYGALAVLATIYGTRIAAWVEAPAVKGAVTALMVVIAVGSAISLYRVLGRRRGPLLEASRPGGP